ncbi:MAG: hypothetical protein WA624_10125, partial [Methylocella sp.]
LASRRYDVEDAVARMCGRENPIFYYLRRQVFRGMLVMCLPTKIADTPLVAADHSEVLVASLYAMTDTDELF